MRDEQRLNSRNNRLTIFRLYSTSRSICLLSTILVSPRLVQIARRNCSKFFCSMNDSDRYFSLIVHSRNDTSPTYQELVERARGIDDLLEAERKGREGGVYRLGITCTRSDSLPSHGSVVKWTISSHVSTMLPLPNKTTRSDVSSCVSPSCSLTYCASMAVEISRYNNLLRHSHQQKFSVQNWRLLKEYKIIPRRIFFLLSFLKRVLLQNNFPSVYRKIVNRVSDAFEKSIDSPNCYISFSRRCDKCSFAGSFNRPCRSVASVE